MQECASKGRRRSSIACDLCKEAKEDESVEGVRSAARVELRWEPLKLMSWKRGDLARQGKRCSELQ